VLTGEGSDEVFGGYDIFKEAKIRRFWAAQPDSKCRPLLLQKLYPYLPNLQAQTNAYRQAFFHVKAEDLHSPFFSHLPRWDLTARLKAFFSDDLKAALRKYDAYADMQASLPGEYQRWDSFAQAQYLETAGLLPGYILSSQGDRVTMGHSVEGRFPFLDYRVVEFAASIPPRLKMKALNEKYILKQVARDLIPAAVCNRPKQPYRAPDAVSFFGDGSEKCGDYVHESLSTERLTQDGLFNPAAVNSLVAKAKQGRIIGVRDNMAVVGILSTQLLVDRYINHWESGGKYGTS
jgi:asparagine synthase (glutamine-hydrolysing)